MEPQHIFTGKTILVTGGTGSFGQAFTKTALTFNPKSIRIFSRSEHIQGDMERDFNDTRLRFFLGDVRDKERLMRATEDVDIVVHAAALKVVPKCEYDPVEAIKTNIVGTANVINASLDNNIDKIILISTDKAVQPLNLYGATKLVAEKIMIQGNSYRGARRTRLSCTRYGNVSFSRGSVIPLFDEQCKTNSLTITDARMTRFWISLQQGVDFVISCISRMQGGEIFIPRIPSVRVADIAYGYDCNIEVTGIRPGEKLHEILITTEEARHTKQYEGYFVIEPVASSPEYNFWKGSPSGEYLPDGFEYTSISNCQWLSRDDIVRAREGAK